MRTILRSGQKKPLILFCWECGAGLGHIKALERVAAEFDATKYSLCLVTPENRPYTNLSSIFTSVNSIASSDMLAPDIVNLDMTSYNSNLYCLGLSSAKITFTRLQVWKQFFTRSKPELIIADYAPFALMAARAMGLKSIATGNGFTLPPTEVSTYPKFINQENSLDDQLILSQVNQALSLSGFARIKYVPDIFNATVQAPCTLKALDPFSKVRKNPVFMPLLGGEIKSVSPNQSDRIFVYLTHCRSQTHEKVLNALQQLNLPVFIYSLQASEFDKERLKNTLVSFLPEPISFDDIVNNHRMIIHLGSYNLANELILAGKPQFIIPIDFEKILTAQLIKNLGAGASYPMHDETPTNRISEAILAAYQEEKLQRNAIAFASENSIPDWRAGAKAVTKSAISIIN